MRRTALSSAVLVTDEAEGGGPSILGHPMRGGSIPGGLAAPFLIEPDTYAEPPAPGLQAIYGAFRKLIDLHQGYAVSHRPSDAALRERLGGDVDRARRVLFAATELFNQGERWFTDMDDLLRRHEQVRLATLRQHASQDVRLSPPVHHDGGAWVVAGESRRFAQEDEAREIAIGRCLGATMIDGVPVPWVEPVKTGGWRFVPAWGDEAFSGYPDEARAKEAALRYIMPVIVRVNRFASADDRFLAQVAYEFRASTALSCVRERLGLPDRGLGQREFAQELQDWEGLSPIQRMQVLRGYVAAEWREAPMTPARPSEPEAIMQPEAGWEVAW